MKSIGCDKRISNKAKMAAVQHGISINQEKSFSVRIQGGHVSKITSFSILSQTELNQSYITDKLLNTLNFIRNS